MATYVTDKYTHGMPFLSGPIGPIFAGVVGIMLAADTFLGRVLGRLYFNDNDERPPLLRRTFVSVALTVFVVSVAAHLAGIRMMHESLAYFFSGARRTEMFLLAAGVNLLNALVAGWLAHRAKVKEERWQARHEELTGYLNHHVRNGLCSIQLAASCTKDQNVVRICNESVERIVSALVTAQEGIPQDDEFLRFQQDRAVC